MSEIAIKFENISKQYRLGTIGTGTLSHDLNRWLIVNVLGKEDPYLKIGQSNNREMKSESDYVWALKDINFEVKKGEVLGIIGKNGAGKSTLLKILSRVTSPSTGRIVAQGRIASLLEVGTGFHPEMTGRENIYMNGSIMGMAKAEITRKLDEIVAFAGVEKYIDTPVKRYSSGMIVRLGFAIAAHMEPEILVVDEVLAVGDAEFQKKAIGKMQDVSHNNGRTVLFVSHNMGAIEQLCQSILVMKNGTVEFTTVDVRTGINRYLGVNSGENNSTIFINNGNIIKNKNFELNRFFITDENRKDVVNPMDNSKDKYLVVDFNVEEMLSSIDIGYRIFDSSNNLVYISQHTDQKREHWPVIKIGNNVLKTKIPRRFLNEGIYRIQLAVSIHEIEWIIDPNNSSCNIFLEIIGGLSDSPHWLRSRSGVLAPELSWEVSQS